MPEVGVGVRVKVEGTSGGGLGEGLGEGLGLELGVGGERGEMG